MTSEPGPSVDQPLGSFEYEWTDELACQAALALFDRQARTVKEGIVREGMPHPVLPIVLASVTLLITQVAGAIWAWDSSVTLPLMVLGCLVHLLLLYKAAVYFCPPFARWYIRRQAVRMTRRLSPRTIRWTFFEDRLETNSAAAQRRMPWSDLRTVEMLSEFWCLQWKSRPLIVSLTVLAPELQTLIQRKANEVGATIV